MDMSHRRQKGGCSIALGAATAILTTVLIFLLR